MGLWDRPWDDDIRILVQLDLASIEIVVGSSMILELWISSFGFLQHRLQGNPLAQLKLVGLLQMEIAEEFA